MSWKEISQIKTNGTILSIASQGERLWLGSPAGLFGGTLDEIKPIVRQIPLSAAHVVQAAGDDLLVAGLPTGVIVSADNGHHWQRATLEQSQHAISCLAPSPNYKNDKIVLAGTWGDGVLRSTNGGGYWQPNTWGMDELDVVALACAPVWERRQFVVAATTENINWSPNGGLAWRAAKRPDEMILQDVLFVSAETVIGAIEQAGLAISQDSGQTWAHLTSPLDSQQVTALLLTKNGNLLAGCGSGDLFVSADSGKTWQSTTAAQSPIFALAEHNNTLLAGLAGDGLLHSADNGTTWQQVENVSIERFAWLAVSDETIAVSGPMAGVYVSADNGQIWQHIAFEHPIRSMAKMRDGVAISSGKQLWHMPFGGEPVVVFEPNDEPLWLTGYRNLWVIGLANGELWAGKPNEENWAKIETPFAAHTLLALEGSAENQLVALTQLGHDYYVWRLAEGKWDVWLQERLSAIAPRIALSDTMAAVSFGLAVFVNAGDGWQRHNLATREAPITALAILDDGSVLACSLDGDYLIKDDGAKRETDSAENAIVAVAKSSSLIALTIEGKLLQR